MAHRNIRPSNILIYQNRSNDNLTLKLADFGLSVVLDKALSLGIKTSSTGPTRTPSDVFASDIFSLGCVFVELESFLAHGGIGGLKKFRDFVRTEYYEGESDDIRDLHSNDKEQAKPEVTAWLFDLSAKNDKCSKLNRITGMMLRDRQARPTAGEVCRKFVEVSLLIQMWTPRDFLMMNKIRANINQPRKWFDGMRSVRLVEPDDLQPPSRIDILKSATEERCGGRIDWWPLSPPRYACPGRGIHVIWDVSDF